VLDEAGQRRVVQRLDNTLAVEFGHTVDGVARRRGRIDRGSLHFAQGETFGVFAREELLVRTGRRDTLERGVGDEVVDPVVDHDPRVATELSELHGTRVLLGQEFCQRLGCLVHVLVGVEDRRAGELGHGHLVRIVAAAVPGAP
jgi:hypothetical protein